MFLPNGKYLSKICKIFDFGHAFLPNGKEVENKCFQPLQHFFDIFFYFSTFLVFY